MDEIAAHLVRYLSFLSFVLGGPMVPAAVRIDRLTLEEMVRAVEAGTYFGEHEVMWNWPADEDEAKDLAFRGAPFLACDDVELVAFEAGLTQWVSRSVAWERAYIRMTACLRLRRVISGERLLAAWRWFEELPNAGAERSFDGAALEPVIRAASDAARDQGLGHVEDRIRGALRQVGEETMVDRFARLVGSVRARFGQRDLLDGMVDHLVNARRFRGRVAHGHFAERDEGEGRRFYKATLAMEALCFLLTARDLPMTDAGRQRIWTHPVLADYSLAYPG